MILDNDLSSSSFASSLAKRIKIKTGKGGREEGKGGKGRNRIAYRAATCGMGREKRRK